MACCAPCVTSTWSSLVSMPERVRWRAIAWRSAGNPIGRYPGPRSTSASAAWSSRSVSRWSSVGRGQMRAEELDRPAGTVDETAVDGMPPERSGRVFLQMQGDGPPRIGATRVPLPCRLSIQCPARRAWYAETTVVRETANRCARAARRAAGVSGGQLASFDRGANRLREPAVDRSGALRPRAEQVGEGIQHGLSPSEGSPLLGGVAIDSPRLEGHLNIHFGGYPRLDCKSGPF